jgi:hypothetical protein
VDRLLEENVETLKQCLQLAKSMGYTNYELMPIIAAYGLKNYRYGKGIGEDVCREVGIDKVILERYISQICSETTDSYVYSKIYAEMSKGFK